MLCWWGVWGNHLMETITRWLRSVLCSARGNAEVGAGILCSHPRCGPAALCRCLVLLEMLQCGASFTWPPAAAAKGQVPRAPAIHLLALCRCLRYARTPQHHAPRCDPDRPVTPLGKSLTMSPLLSSAIKQGQHDILYQVLQV